MKTPLQTIQAYHQRSKHHFQRYAAGPGALDWKNQPDPFRTYDGCTMLEMPLLVEQTSASYNDLYQPEQISSQALSLKTVAQLLELSFGLSAWKQYENTRWALRCNPSSGNLHPTESYVIAENCEGMSDGVYHYVSRDHILEKRCQFNHEKSLLPASSLLIGLSSIHWREAWKYGERAFRYCQLDVGHAIAAVGYAAATLGWKAQVLTCASDADIETILGIDREIDFATAEREHADVMLLISAGCEKSSADVLSLKKIAETVHNSQWYGQANTLSSQHLDDWPVIAEAARACRKPATDEQVWHAPAISEPIAKLASRELAASSIIRQRRSAQEFDSNGSITAQVLYRMLDLTLPRQTIPPWDSISWEPRLHLLIFIHRVEGLEPGLYLFLRNDGIRNKFQAGIKREYEWLKPKECPEHLQLFRLETGDARNAAKTLSCHQDIASDGALSLAMLAEYESNLTKNPWVYRQLFWEAGILGQVLYLEAESSGFRGTGIGCFFDDGVHELLAIEEYTFQSMYHFTIGMALTDNRLQTLPPYAHLQRGNMKQV